MDFLTPAEARSAIYIDFEGNEKLPPTLVGVRWRAAERDHFEQFVIEEAMVPAVEGPAKTTHRWPRDYTRAEGGSTDAVAVARAVDTLPGILLKLVIRAESESRLLVSWSGHERDVLCSISDADTGMTNRFLTVWRDGRATAKQWKRRTHPSVKFEPVIGSGTHRLDQYLKLIHYQVPPHFGFKQAAARISYVRNQLQKRETYDRLTPVAKAKWTKLLDYNWHDCNGLREVVLTAARV